MDDLISRQAAIDAIDRLDIPEDMCVFEILGHIELEIGNLPSAHPEIIRCEDCKHYNAGFECLIEGYGIERNKNWYCADAERRAENSEESDD